MRQRMTFIVIIASKADPGTLKEVLAGIEEEGTVCSVNIEKRNMDSITLAKDASVMSSMGIGLGIKGSTVHMSVQHQMKPVIVDCSGLASRTIGQNAGKYLKNKPLSYQ